MSDARSSLVFVLVRARRARRGRRRLRRSAHRVEEPIALARANLAVTGSLRRAF